MVLWAVSMIIWVITTAVGFWLVTMVLGCSWVVTRVDGVWLVTRVFLAFLECSGWLLRCFGQLSHQVIARVLRAITRISTVCGFWLVNRVF